jgi:hypothetical protein
MDDDLPPQGIPTDEWAATSPFMRQAFHVLLSIVAQQQQHSAHLQQRVVDLEAKSDMVSYLPYAQLPPRRDLPDYPDE